MVEGKKFTKNILIVTISNVIRLVAGMAIGLVIPKFLSKADYGYYKTYTLYVTYISLFTLGLIDGIYLKYGGQSYDELDKAKFRCYTRALFYLEAVMSVIIFLLSFFLFKGQPKIIFVSIAANLVAQQLLTYFAQVSQLSSKFSILSIFNLLWSIATIIGVGILCLIPNANYISYIIIVVSTNYLLLIFYMITYRSIIFGKSEKIWSNKDTIIGLMKLGMPLLIANLVSTLILSCDRIFGERIFDKEVFASYSFAYSLFSIANTFITAISMVLYPILKNMKEGSLKSNYNRAMALMLMIVFTGLAMYFPLYAFIEWYLDIYVDALIIFRIILPGLAMSSCISVVMQNYYKVANKNLSFFIKSVIVLGISVGANFGIMFLCKDPRYLSGASVITLAIWYFLTEFFFIKEYKINTLKNTSFLLLATAAFYLISWIPNLWIGFAVYVLCMGGMMFLYYHSLIIKLFRQIFGKKEASV